MRASDHARPRFIFVDALRGLAALSVVLFHAWEGGHLATLAPTLHAVPRTILQHGHTGVSVFFVISGFVIAHSMASEHVTGRYIGRFALRRAVRLDPPYWASIVLAIALGVLSARLVPGKVYELPSWQNLALHLAYLPVIFDVPLVNNVYWTLCLEVQFYLTFVVLMWGVTWLSQRMPRERALDIVLYGATIVSNLWPLGLVPAPYGFFCDFWHLFLTGAVVWRAVASGPAPRPHGPYYVALAQLAVLALAARLRPEEAGLLVGTGTALLLLMVGALERLTRWLSWRALQGLGAISYSLYLTHNAVTGVSFRVGYRLTPRTPAWEAFWLLAMVLASIAFAWGFYRLVEQPTLRFSKRIMLSSRPSRPLAEPLAASTVGASVDANG